MKKTILVLTVAFTYLCHSQLPPKETYPFDILQIHSGHSLTDPLFNNWPGQYMNLVGEKLSVPPWTLADKVIVKSVVPGSTMHYRWDRAPEFGPDARWDIPDWKLLTITERVPLHYEGGGNQDWYLERLRGQRKYLSLFVNNAWNNGNNRNGTPTLLWTTWVNIDGRDGNFRQMLDLQGGEWEKMQDYANQNRPAGAPPVYIIPGHKMMARLYDDIQRGIVPGISNINQFFSDPIHPNELGAYAVTLIHYACIFNQSPVGLTNNLLPGAPAGTPIPSVALATYLQNMIWEVVTSYPRTGVSKRAIGIADHAPKSNDFITYPNPAKDYLHLSKSNTNYKYKVYNVFGKMVGSGNKNRINVSELPAGNYILKTGNTHKNFVKLAN